MPRPGIVTVLLWALAGCAYLPQATDNDAAGTNGAQPFADAIWVTTRAGDVDAGHMRVFLSDGSLLAAPPQGRPAVGRWRRGPGGLQVTVAGRTRTVEVISSGPTRLHLRRSGNNGNQDLIMVRAAHSLWGTSWRLLAIDGDSLVGGAAPTLSFPEPGRVAGEGGCNSYFGSVALGDGVIELGRLASTRMACPGAAGKRESDYFRVLRASEGFKREGETLVVTDEAGESRLRFERVAGAKAPRPGQEGTASAFRAVGQEPGWHLRIRPGEHMRFVHDYGAGEVVTPVPNPRRDGSRVIYRVVTESGELRVEIVDEPCRDVMSGERFASTVRVTYDGETFNGCGGTPP